MKFGRWKNCRPPICYNDNQHEITHDNTGGKMRNWMANKWGNGGEVYDFVINIVAFVLMFLAFGFVGGIECGTIPLPF